MTHGDAQSVKCPACKKVIDRPVAGHEPTQGRMVEFDSPCPHCKVVLHYWARLAVAVDCEKESKLS